MKTTLLATLALALLAGPATAQPAPTTAPSALGHTVLMIDDNDVLYRSGTERIVRPADRHGNDAIIAQEFPWELTIAFCSAYRNPETGKYQIWYQGYAGTSTDAPKSMQCVVCYAESDDGVTFTKPKLDLFPFKDIKQTNIVLIGNGIPGTGDRYGNTVIVDPRETDPAKKYKMAYYDWTMMADGRAHPGLCVAYSPDGIHWTKYEKGPLGDNAFGRAAQPAFADEDPQLLTPVKGKPSKFAWRLPLTMSDAFDVMWDPQRQVFGLYGKMWIDSPTGSTTWKHCMGYSESKDFVTWSKAQLLMTPDDDDAPDVDFHTTPVFSYNGVYVLLNEILDRKHQGTIDIELGTSRDGVHFKREYRAQRFLPRNSVDGSFDGRAIFTNSTPVILNDEIRFYYGAYNTSPIGGGYEQSKPKSGIGFATIPIDRFGGVKPVALSDQKTLKHPLENIGQVTLKPMSLAGVKEIAVNADASKGHVYVEVLDESGYRVRGYDKASALPIDGDTLHQAATWKSAKLADLPPGNYELRIHLDNATLYAVDFK